MTENNDRIDEATARGREAGHAAGTWVIDGNTSAETAARIVKGYEDGDPETMDMQPAAISNYERDGLEHPGDALGDLLYDNSNEDQSYGELADDQAITSAYEEAFTDAYWAEVIRSARALMVEVTMYGGGSYALGDPEHFPSYRAACIAWADRWSSNGTRKVDGVYWPTWGDMADDDYAITVEADGLTREQVLAVADGGPMPFGWDD